MFSTLLFPWKNLNGNAMGRRAMMRGKRKMIKDEADEKQVAIAFFASSFSEFLLPP
jgi:hypothetical protein